MNHKTFLSVVGVIFCLMAVVHLIRIIFGWEAAIVGWVVPIWLSWIGVALAGVLGYFAFRFASEK